MKAFKVFIIGIVTMSFILNGNAQTKSGADYFIGGWNVLVKGTPNGDAKMIVNLEKNDSTLTGFIQDSTGKEIGKISSLELKENQLTIYFTAQGYDVYLVMDKKDDDHFTGNLMGMFDAEGDRIKK